MADTIYTIPVSEAFEADCECPVCELKKRFENSTVEYFAGPSLMEPDTRIVTNDLGFCGRHFNMLYNSQAKKLGLGLMLDTYMQEQLKRIKKYAQAKDTGTTEEDASRDPESGENHGEKRKKFSLFGGKNASKPAASQPLVRYLRAHEKECAVCKKLDYTMDRYVDIIFHMYKTDRDFRAKFRSSKGFCVPHTALLLEESGKKLGGSTRDEFRDTVTSLLVTNLERIEGEVDWFTKKFDYRNAEADWGNSRDALPRGILKMTGETDIIK